MAQSIDEELVLGHKYRFSFDYTELPNNAAGLVMYYYNSLGQGFSININLSGTGTYSAEHTIGESITTSSWSGGRQRLIIHSNSSNLFTRYAIDNITLQNIASNQQLKEWDDYLSPERKEYFRRLAEIEKFGLDYMKESGIDVKEINFDAFDAFGTKGFTKAQADELGLSVF